MKPNAYLRPTPYTWEKVDVRNPLPIYPPPEPLAYPSLPSPSRKPIFNAPYTLSTHIFPACYLRTTRPVPVPKPPPVNATKEERRRILKETEAGLTSMRTLKDTDGYPAVLWNCVNRYVKNGLDSGNRTGVTLFFAHANGFPKEIWEPTLAYLLASPIASIIDEIWLWESIQHGDAGLINAPNASGLFDWMDNGRDISNFFLHYLPSAVTDAKLPTFLTRVPRQESEFRSKQGFSNRKLIAIGHSYGGCTSTLAASFFPALFDTLILVDPVIVQPFDHAKQEKTNGYVGGALSRRETWASREEALESFRSNPFFAAWDSEVLKIYVECGLYTTTLPDGTPIARLKMPGVQEAIVFSEIHTESEAFDRLSRLDDRIALRWIMPGKPGSRELGLPGSTQRRVWVRTTNVSNTKILGGGHLIPQEAPTELADDLNEYLLERLSNHSALRARANL